MRVWGVCLCQNSVREIQPCNENQNSWLPSASPGSASGPSAFAFALRPKASASRFGSPRRAFPFSASPFALRPSPSPFEASRRNSVRRISHHTTHPARVCAGRHRGPRLPKTEIFAGTDAPRLPCRLARGHRAPVPPVPALVPVPVPLPNGQPSAPLARLPTHLPMNGKKFLSR